MFQIGDFRKFAGPTDQYVIPEVPEKRRTTDLKFTIIFAVCLLILVYLLTTMFSKKIWIYFVIVGPVFDIHFRLC
jgi:hypothetical protein